MIAVITPVYNAEDYIGRCIESVKSQTFKDFVHYVVNDGSTDSTLAKIKLCTHERLKVLSSKNSGVASARNWALDEAQRKGFQWIAFLDADDYWSSSFLEIAWNSAQLYKADLVTGPYYRYSKHQGSSLFYPQLNRLTSSKVLTGCDISCLSTLCRLPEIRFENYLREDLMFWYKYLQVYKCVGVYKDPCSFYTLHSGNSSGNKTKMAKGQWEIYRSLKFSLVKSIFFLIKWAFYGLRKYS